MIKLAIERLGIAWLITDLEKQGIRVAFPEKDTGIDLIAFEDTGCFRAAPIQVKAFSSEAFYTNRKYLRKADLRIVYLWNVQRLDKVSAFCLLYSHAEKIVDAQDRSRKDGVYYTKASKRIRDALAPYLVQDWKTALFGK